MTHILILYFSGMGNTKRVAKMIAHGIKPPCYLLGYSGIMGIQDYI